MRGTLRNTYTEGVCVERVRSVVGGGDVDVGGALGGSSGSSIVLICV